jgi:hypothetical protein
MKRLAVMAALAFALAPDPASAQGQQPYAGLETRPIKALSDEQIADLRAGRGMGLAMAAELNGYPGPLHVLDLAQALELSDAQREKVQQLFSAMKTEAVALGEQLIARETDLDRQFAGRTITEASLAAAMQGIAATQAALRTVHLRYHLLSFEVLASNQVQRYAELRGYAGGRHRPHRHGGHRH